MKLENLKNIFISYLEENNKLKEIGENNENVNYEDISIFTYANEFKSFLESEYDASETDIMSKSISDILNMEIEFGKLVDKTENEDTEIEEEDNESINTNRVISSVEDKIENELGSDMSRRDAKNIVERFDGKISDAVNDEILEGEISNFDIFKDVFNELGKNTKFVEAIDVDKSNDISQNELEDFLNSIKGFDDNQEDVSVNDLLTAATQINEGRFQFISQTNNHADIKNTNSVSSTINNVPTVETTTPQKINSVDSEMSNISTGNTSSVGNTSNCGNTNLNSVMDFGSGAGSNLDAMTSELEGLQTEKTETEQDLSTQTEQLDSTQNEKEQVVGDLCSEIETGNQDLTTAQDDVSTTQEQRDTAATDVENAQQQTQCSKTEADNAASDLTNAQNQTDAAQDTSDTAADNNTQAIQAEEAAQDDSNTANDNLTTAVGNTDAAQGVADTKGSELKTASVEASQAFSVLNVKNQEVQKAQTEYNNAKAQQKNASQNIFQKIASWVSNLFNALSDAIAGRDHAQAEADRKAEEEEKAQIASDEALEALEERKDEQAEAQSVADAAEVVLARATGEREVSDQEYAEALIALASAMESEENAESEYNTAFDNYLQCNNYQVDAEGRLQDAEGNYISATQVAQELETYVLGLVETRDTKETEYDEVIQATTEVIAGDESKIEELDSKITDLQAQIEQEKENIALQEAMITELSTEQSEVNAANESAGIADGFMSLFGAGNAADQKALDDKKAILEEALLSGDSEKIAEAYRAIYGDKEVIVDAAGNVVNPAELTEEQLAQCSVANIKDLSNDNLSSIMHNDAAAINNAAQTMEIINNGVIVCDGEEVSMDVLNDILKEQVAAMAADMDNAVDRQGIISKGAGALNNLLGIGTSETEARAQVDVYLQLAAQLDSCTDPVEYAALFKQITGKDFSVETVAELLAYDKVSNGKSTDTKVETDNTATAGKADITEYVNTLTDAVNEDEELNEDALSLTKDNTAREAIEDYKETQETAKDAVIGVVSGVASTVVVTVCSAAGICAAPFTGGASLSLIAAGFGIAGGTGALVSSGLNAIDSIYDADGDGNLDFNYSWKEFGKDFLIGGLNGIVGNLANGAGAAVTGKISTQAAQTAVTTTLKETVKKGAVNFGGKLAGAAVEGFIDGSVSASGEYAINALLDDDVDFSFQQFAETGLQGGIIGSVFNVGMTASTSGLSALADGVQSRNFRADINDFLSEGTTNNQLAELVAGKLDDSLLDADGMVNKYAAGQLMKNAETALDSLQSYYKSINLDPNDAIKALDNISLADMPNVPTMLSALRQLDLPGIDMTTAEGISDGLSKIDGIEVNPNGTLSSMKVISDGQEITFDFDNNGKLTAVGLSNSGNDVDIDLDDTNIHVDGDGINVDGDDLTGKQIEEAQTLAELASIQDSIDSIQDPNIKIALQEQLDNKAIELKNAITSTSQPFSPTQFEQELIDSGFVKNSNGNYSVIISKEYEEKIMKQYGPYVGNQILNKAKAGISQYEMDELMKFANVANGRYASYWKGNMQELALYYHVLKSGQLFNYFDEITDVQWEAIMNTVQNKANKDVLDSLAFYKGSGYQNINGALTALKTNPNTPIPADIQNYIDNITKYIDTQEISDTMHVFRGEGFSVLESVKIDQDGHTLRDLLENVNPNDKDAINRIIEQVLDNNYVATQERFMSTALVFGGSFDYQPIIWELEVPAGTKGVFLEGTNLTGVSGNEIEYLLQRNTKIEITGISYENGKWHLQGKVKNN